MDLFFFFIGILLYLVFTNFLVKTYRTLSIRFGWPKPSGIINVIVCYTLFAIFVCLVIPFVFLFPIWLNSIAPAIEDTEMSRVILILSGCTVLPAVMWLNYKKETLGFNLAWLITIAIKNAPVGRSTRNKLLAFVAGVMFSGEIVRKEGIKDPLKECAFDFFYWFSRFEFALKENRYLKRNGIGENAEPGWDAFVEKYAETFAHTAETNKLIELNPKRQKVGENSDLQWQEVGLADCRSQLCRVVRLLKTIRNNLFHGGKHGADGWDNPARTQDLLVTGKSILDQLARLADIEADYTQYY